VRTNDPGDSVLARATRILRSFSEDTPELDLSQLTELTGLPRSTVHRLAAELVELGHLDRMESGRYTVGLGLWELGELAAVSIRLRELALPHLLTLFAATSENVHLAVLSGTEALYVARLTGSSSIPTLSRMGGRLPLHTTGVGKALLSAMDDDWLASYFALPRERDTMHSVTDERALRREIATARQRGYATTRQEMTLGSISFAAPLAPLPGLPRAAVGVVTHLTRGDNTRLAPLVLRAATDISQELSH
jgi:DNA-binding IclR family transcriptional regulator